MPLALFDLDNTLLSGDSDYLWGCFLVEKGIVDGRLYDAANERFYRLYAEGELDIHEYLRFALTPLASTDSETLSALHAEFMDTKIRPLMTTTGIETIARHRSQGDQPVIITATNSFVTAPIARAFGIDELIATEPEVIDGRYTGNVAGTPCFKQGKVERLRDWQRDSGMGLEGSWFYSDSHNDLPLLRLVDHPVAVDPDRALRAEAEQNGWQITSFR
jgi:HAD superfamily hydrolase (TIGR01490 family)